MPTTGRPGGSRLDTGYNRGYTRCMKTAISIPDELFEAAERVAKQLRVSRSELYRKALVKYLESQPDTAITASASSNALRSTQQEIS